MPTVRKKAVGGDSDLQWLGQTYGLPNLPGSTSRYVPLSGRRPDLEGERDVSIGAGCFDEFLWIFADDARNSNLDIAEQTQQLRSIFHNKPLNQLSDVLNEYKSGLQDLVQWGVTDNADLLVWIAAGDPESWPTVIIQAGQLGAVASPRSSTATVLQLLTGSLRVPFFPSDFPNERPEFSANPYA